MNQKRMSRPAKVRLLAELFRGNPAPLVVLNATREPDLSYLTDAELQAILNSTDEGLEADSPIELPRPLPFKYAGFEPTGGGVSKLPERVDFPDR